MGFAVSRHNSDLCSVPPFLDDFQQLAIILAKTVRRIVNIEIKYQTIHATRTMRTDTQEARFADNRQCTTDTGKDQRILNLRE